MGHEDEGASLAVLLRAAMDRMELSNRGLAVKLAGGTRNKDEIDKHRKTVRRILGGKQHRVQPTTAAALERILETPAGYWPTSRRTARPRYGPIEAAEKAVRLLDAGEAVPMEARERLAVQLVETAELCRALAARLRQEAVAEGSGR